MTTARNWLEPGHINARPEDMTATGETAPDHQVQTGATVASSVQGKQRWVQQASGMHAARAGRIDAKARKGKARLAAREAKLAKRAARA